MGSISVAVLTNSRHQAHLPVDLRVRGLVSARYEHNGLALPDHVPDSSVSSVGAATTFVRMPVCPYCQWRARLAQPTLGDCQLNELPDCRGDGICHGGRGRAVGACVSFSE